MIETMYISIKLINSSSYLVISSCMGQAFNQVIASVIASLKSLV